MNQLLTGAGPRGSAEGPSLLSYPASHQTRRPFSGGKTDLPEKEMGWPSEPEDMPGSPGSHALTAHIICSGGGCRFPNPSAGWLRAESLASCQLSPGT